MRMQAYYPRAHLCLLLARAPLHVTRLRASAPYAHGQWRREPERQRSPSRQTDLLATRREDDSGAGPAAGRAADRRAFSSADQSADDGASGRRQSDLERVLLLGAGRHAADGCSAELVPRLFTAGDERVEP